jgi:hypothetical protein
LEALWQKAVLDEAAAPFPENAQEEGLQLANGFGDEYLSASAI